MHLPAVRFLHRAYIEGAHSLSLSTFALETALPPQPILSVLSDGPSTQPTYQTLGPILVILLLWTKPLFFLLAGRKDAVRAAAQDATAWSMLLLELCLPSVSTQISETFVCEVFPDEGE